MIPPGCHLLYRAPPPPASDSPQHSGPVARLSGCGRQVDPRCPAGPHRPRHRAPL